VPLAITVERAVIADAPVSLETVEVSTGLITLEIGADIVLRVPGDVAVERVAALVRAMRGAV
jgi:transposase